MLSEMGRSFLGRVQVIATQRFMRFVEMHLFFGV